LIHRPYYQKRRRVLGKKKCNRHAGGLKVTRNMLRNQIKKKQREKSKISPKVVKLTRGEGEERHRHRQDEVSERVDGDDRKKKK